MNKERRWVWEECLMIGCLVIGASFARPISAILRGKTPELRDFLVDWWVAAMSTVGALAHYSWAFKWWRNQSGKPGIIKRAVGALSMGAGWRTILGGGD